MRPFIVYFGMLLILLGCKKINAPVFPEIGVPEMQPLTVMTYNVNIGSAADELMSVENLLDVPAEVTKVYNNVMASDFPGRAMAIAKSIKTYHPHLIGLQEISLIRRQSPGDAIIGGTVPAAAVVMDYLQIVMDALKAEGLNYRIAASVENTDIELPMFTDAGLDDVRLTDYDVILARGDVEVSRPIGENYANTFTLEMPALKLPGNAAVEGATALGVTYRIVDGHLEASIVVQRGYAAVDATVSGITYRIVNTHLEAFDSNIRVAQAQELTDRLREERLPILLLGDFNSAAPDGRSYQLLQSAGYVDLWQADSEGTGKTCCQDDDLKNEVSDLSKRVDIIFLRNLQLPADVLTHTVGDKPSDRSASGLWASDHAGVVAQIINRKEVK